MSALRKIEAYDLELYAINTGELYRQHCLLAALGADTLTWREHLINIVVPRYRKEIESAAYVDSPTVTDVAKRLKEYYDQHIKEMMK